MPELSSDDYSGSGHEEALSLLRAASYQEYLSAHPGLSRTMRARDREIRLGADDQYFFSAFTDPIHFVVVASPTHRDTAIIVPLLEHVRRCLPRGSFCVVEPDRWAKFARRTQVVPLSLRDLQAAELPHLFVLDGQLGYLGEWGPQPEAFDSYLQAWMAEENGGDATLPQLGTADSIPLHVIRMWYNSGLNVDCAAEIRSLLEVSSANSPGSENVGEGDGAASGP